MTKQPSYRFADYTEPWAEKKLGEVAEIYDGTHQTPIYTTEGVMFLSVENIRTLHSDKYISKDAFDKDFKISPKSGDVLMTRIGDIGTSNIVETDIDLAYYVSLALIRSCTIESKFLNVSISSDYFQKELWKRTLHIAFPKKINKNEIGQSKFFYPSLPEQTAIGSFFQDIDQLISLQQRKLEVLKDQKKTYLKLLFPAKGQTKPALRFAGFEDDWMEVKLGEVLTERNIQMVPSDQVPLVSFTVENGVTPKTERYNREFLVREESKKYKYTRYNDIVYNPANLKFGAIARNKYGEAVFSPIYVTFEVNYSNILPEFIEGILTSKDFIQQALKFQEGTVYERMAVKADDFTRLAITVPSLPEQKAIGSFFQDLDKAIAKQEEKVNQLKESKQTLLRKMFI